MRFERIPGAYHCSREGTRVIYGLKILNPPRALAELIEEVNHASPKQVFFFDSGPVEVKDNPHAVNWTDHRNHASLIPIFLNPKRAAPELVAHELMHAWIDFYGGLEDHRVYFNPANKSVANAVNFLQSMVLDCTVLWRLQGREGFDLDFFRRDVLSQLKEHMIPLQSGMMHATPFGQLAAAQALAVTKACPDLYGLTKKDMDEVERFWEFCWKVEPVIARTAGKLATALGKHGYQTEAGIRASIDGALSAAFEFLSIPFDREKDMVPTVGYILSADKMPDYMAGWPLSVKHEALCRSVWYRRPILWSSYTPEKKNVLVHYAREGLPYSSLMLPPITRPKEAGAPKHLFFFEAGTTTEEMKEWEPRKSSLPFPPLDIYAQTYNLSPLSATEPPYLSSGGKSHVLLP